MFGHMVANFGPNSQKGALALVVTGTIFMGGAKVSGHDWAINGRHDLAQGQILRRAGEDITAADTSFGGDDAGPFEGEENLFQVRLRKSRSFGNITH
jgi:hypothetical protein